MLEVENDLDVGVELVVDREVEVLCVIDEEGVDERG